MPIVLDILCVAVAAATLSIPLIFLNIRYAHRLGLIDWPKARGMSEEQVPLVGASLVVLSVATMLLLNHLYDLSPWFIVTATFIAAMGYIDDRKPIPAMEKMFFQILCVSAMVLLDPQMHRAMIEPYGVWGALGAIFFIVGMVNAVNFIDGIDGLAGVILILGTIGFLFFQQVTEGFYPQAILAAVILGALFPFLFVNVKLRRGFLGNIGSYFFSYCLVVMHLSLPLKCEDIVSRLSLSGLCFLVPIADSLMVISMRLFSFRSPFQPDKGHLHHRLIQASIPLSWILFNFAAIELSALGVGILLARNHAIKATMIPGFICVSHIAITAILILLVEKASKRRIQTYFQRLDTGEPIYFLKYQFTKQDGTPISMPTLRRLEARVSAEIRVTDLCFSEKPNTLFVTLKTMPEPLRGISGRLDAIFQSERVTSNVVVDQGEFVKVSRNASVPSTPPPTRKSA